MPWDIKQKHLVITFPDSDNTTYTTDFIIDSYQKIEVYHNNLRGADNSLRLTVPFHEGFADKLKQYVNKDIQAKVINKDDTTDFAGYLRKNFKIEKQKRPQPIALEIVNPSFLLKKSQGKDNAFILKEKTVTQICNALLEKAGFTNNSAVTISNIIPVFTAEEDEEYYAIVSDLLFEYGYTFDFDASGGFVILPLFNKPAGTPSQVFNRNNIRSSLEQKIEEQKNSSNITLEWSTLSKLNRVTLYENTEGRYAAYPDGCKLDVYPGKYLFNNEINNIEYDSSLGEVVWVDTIYQDIRAPHPLSVELCENLGKSCNLSVKNTGSVTAYVTKLRITGDAYIKVEEQRTRSPGSGDEKAYALKYNHDSPVVSQLTKNIAEYNLYSNLKIALQSEDDYPVGSFAVIVEDYMGTVIGRIVKKTTVLRDFFKYEIESITEYDPIENPDVLMKPSGKMAALLAVPPDVTAPSVPVITSIAALSSGGIEVTFSSSTDSESGVYFYNIYRCQAGTETGTGTGTGTKDTPIVIYTVPHDGSAAYTFSDHSTENRKWYFYAVSAVDKANNESARSAETRAVAVVSDEPKSPYLIKAEVDTKGVDLLIFVYNPGDEFRNEITQTYYFRLQASFDNGATYTDIGKIQGNVFRYNFSDSFTPGYEDIGKLKFRAYSLNIFNVQSTTPIQMMNHRTRFNIQKFGPPFEPGESDFTSTVSSGSSDTTISNLAPGWYLAELKAGGGGGGGGGQGGAGATHWGNGQGDNGNNGKQGGDTIFTIVSTGRKITAYGGLGGNGGGAAEGQAILIIAMRVMDTMEAPEDGLKQRFISRQ
jgi:hypothetical protein